MKTQKPYVIACAVLALDIKNTAAKLIRILGPNRSFNRPIKMPNKPMIKNAAEDAPDMAALDHPNVSIRGLKKTP